MPSEKLKVLFLTLYPETIPSSRLRIYQYFPYFQRAGLQAKIKPLLPEPLFSKLYYSRSKAVKFLQYFLELKSVFLRVIRCFFYDIIVIQKGILLTNLRGLERLFVWTGKKIIFDIDDSMYGMSVVEFSRPALRFLQDPHQTEKLSRHCYAVTAGNTYLTGKAKTYNSRVYLLPTPVDTSRITLKTVSGPFKDQRVVIGWLGMTPGLEHFELIEEALRIICERYPVTVRMVTLLKGQPFSIQGVPLEFKDWTLEGENSDFHSFDIAISPLKDNEWTRGKCSLKLLQYMAAGLPTVSSKNGMNVEVIEDGVDGFLAEGTLEWVEKLSRLIEDTELRRRMGKAARGKVERDYDLTGRAETFIRILKDTGCAR